MGSGFGLGSHDGFRLTGNEAVGWRGVGVFGLTGGKGVLLGSRIHVELNRCAVVVWGAARRVVPVFV